MTKSGARPGERFQTLFHRRWRHLSNPHVRSLAWLLDSPDLLDPAAPRWKGRIAALPLGAAQAAKEWLAALDRSPGPLHDYLQIHSFMRLGRYAEKLMAFYFRSQDILLEHGLQVKGENNQTVGEFDFLLKLSEGLAHWEFATKFYLLHADRQSTADGLLADYFVGPGLSDTLGTKMNKILCRQLALGRHPAAQMLLPQPVVKAQALIKGWLFYHCGEPFPDAGFGISSRHCRGFWCELQEFEPNGYERFIILPRLQWLAPAQVNIADTMTFAELLCALERQFEEAAMPALIAILACEGGEALEIARGFVTPCRWRERAAVWQRSEPVTD